MDYSILYAIGFIVLAGVIVFGVSYARKKGIFSSEDLKTASSLLGLTVSVLNELNLKNEDQLIKISTMILKGLDYAIVSMNLTNKDEIISTTETYVYGLCTDNGIELTDSRKLIINSLVSLVLTNKYADKIVS